MRDNSLMRIFLRFLVAFVALLSAGCGNQSSGNSCFEEPLVHEKLIRNGKNGIDFSFSKKCFRGRLNDGEQLLITAYTIDLIQKKLFEKKFTEFGMSTTDRMHINEKHRVDITLTYVSADDYIKRSKDNLIGQAGKIDNNKEFMILSENKYTAFDNIFFPTDDSGIYIGCITRCELTGVYERNIGYSISFPMDQFDNWRSYKNKAIGFINTARQN